MALVFWAFSNDLKTMLGNVFNSATKRKEYKIEQNLLFFIFSWSLKWKKELKKKNQIEISFIQSYLVLFSRSVSTISCEIFVFYFCSSVLIKRMKPSFFALSKKNKWMKRKILFRIKYGTKRQEKRMTETKFSFQSAHSD